MIKLLMILWLDLPLKLGKNFKALGKTKNKKQNKDDTMLLKKKTFAMEMSSTLLTNLY